MLEQSGEQSIPDTVVFQLYIIGVDAGLYELDVVHTDTPSTALAIFGTSLELPESSVSAPDRSCLPLPGVRWYRLLDLTVVDNDDAVTDGTDLAQNV